MKQKPTIQESPLLVEKMYTFGDVAVAVRIDFKQKHISLIDTKTNGAKQWVFGKRELEYMQGWLNILEAMKQAIIAAEKELKEYVEKEEARAIHYRLEIQGKIQK